MTNSFGEWWREKHFIKIKENLFTWSILQHSWHHHSITTKALHVWGRLSFHYISHCCYYNNCIPCLLESQMLESKSTLEVIYFLLHFVLMKEALVRKVKELPKVTQLVSDRAEMIKTQVFWLSAFWFIGLPLWAVRKHDKP